MNAIRKLQFIVRGYRNFTKSEKPLPTLQGSLESLNYVITGANSGIGFEAARFAAERKANVYLVCRNPQRGQDAVKQLIELTKNENIFLILGEMGGKHELDQVYEEIKKKVQRIDIFVHNAGCMLHKREYTKDGLENNFATNSFTVYYLTKLCFPLLHAQSRIIITASGGLLTQKLVTKDLFMEEEEFDGTAQYARNKRQQVCIAQEFSKMHQDKGKFLVMHPGWVDTPAVREAMPDFHKKMKDKLKEAPEGADTINYLSVAPLESLKSGQFYYDREITDKHLTIACTSYDQKQADLLMKRMRELSGI